MVNDNVRSQEGFSPLSRIFSCPDCGVDVSKKAQACPNCGCPIKKPQSRSGCGVYVGLALLLWLFVGLFGDKAAESPLVAKTAEQVREAEVEKAFSAWDGSHRALTRWIKKRLKDPSSYEHIKTRYTDYGDYIFVVTDYRARNSFGAFNVERVTAKAASDGTLTEIISSP